MPSIRSDLAAVLARAGASYSVTADNKCTLSGSVSAENLEEIERAIRVINHRASLVSGTYTIQITR